MAFVLLQDKHDSVCTSLDRPRILEALAQRDREIQHYLSWQARQRQVLLAVKTVERRRTLLGAFAAWRDALASRHQRRRRDALRVAAERARLEAACDALLANLKHASQRQLEVGLARIRSFRPEQHSRQAHDLPSNGLLARSPFADPFSPPSSPSPSKLQKRERQEKAARNRAGSATGGAGGAAGAARHATTTTGAEAAKPSKSPAPASTPMAQLVTPTPMSTPMLVTTPQQTLGRGTGMGGRSATPWSEASTAASLHASHGRAPRAAFPFPKVPPLPLLGTAAAQTKTAKNAEKIEMAECKHRDEEEEEDEGPWERERGTREEEDQQQQQQEELQKQKQHQAQGQQPPPQCPTQEQQRQQENEEENKEAEQQEQQDQEDDEVEGDWEVEVPLVFGHRVAGPVPAACPVASPPSTDEQALQLARGVAALATWLARLGSLQRKAAFKHWTESTWRLGEKEEEEEEEEDTKDAATKKEDNEEKEEENKQEAKQEAEQDLQENLKELRADLLRRQLRRSQAEASIRKLVERGEVLEEEKARLARVVEARSKEEVIVAEQLRALQEALQAELEESQNICPKLERKLEALREMGETLREETAAEEGKPASRTGLSRLEGRVRTQLHLELSRKEAELDALRAEAARLEQVQALQDGSQLTSERWRWSQARSELQTRVASLREELWEARRVEAETLPTHKARCEELSTIQQELRRDLAAKQSSEPLDDDRSFESGDPDQSRLSAGAQLTEHQLKELDCYATLVDKLRTEVAEERQQRDAISKELSELRKSYRLLLTQASQRCARQTH